MSMPIIASYPLDIIERLSPQSTWGLNTDISNAVGYRLVTIVSVYFSTCLLWMLLHYRDTKATIAAATSQYRLLREVFDHFSQ